MPTDDPISLARSSAFAAGYSQATIDAAHDWLNNSDHADAYGEADTDTANRMLLKACADLVFAERGEKKRVDRLQQPAPASRVADCACYYNCGEDSRSQTWHQHPDDPCPVHPDAPMIG